MTRDNDTKLAIAKLVLLMGYDGNVGVGVDEAAFKLEMKPFDVLTYFNILNDAYEPPVVSPGDTVILPNGFIQTYTLNDEDGKNFEWAKNEYVRLTGKEKFPILLEP